MFYFLKWYCSVYFILLLFFYLTILLKCIHINKHLCLCFLLLYGVVYYTHPPHFTYQASQHWISRLPLMPCYHSNSEAKTFIHNPLWNCERFSEVHTQGCNDWTEAIYKHNWPAFYQIAPQYNFTSLYSQQKYIKVPLENYFYFSS